MDTRTILSRRSILKALPAVAIAPATLLPTAAYAGPGESPAFLDAVHKLGAALGRLDDTLDAKTRALATFDAIAPVVPAELRAINNHLSEQGYTSNFCVAERLQDGDSQDVWRGNRPLQVLVSWGLEKQIRFSDGRTTRGKEDRRLHRIALAYEQEVEQARTAANLPVIREAHYWADDDVRRAAMALAHAPATTMRGALLKVRGWMAAASRQRDIRHQVYGQSLILENVACVLDGVS